MKTFFTLLVLLLPLLSIATTNQNVKTVYFENDSYELTKDAKDYIKTHIENFKLHELELKGYSDVNGSETYNLELSQKRANSVKDFLVLNGVYENDIKLVKGMGESSTYSSLAKNRRVEIIIGKEIVVKEIIETLPETDTTPPKKTIHQPTSIQGQILNLKVGETLVLKKIQFYPGRATPLPSAIPAIKELVQIMKDNPTLKIDIQGHICCTKCDRTVKNTLKVEKSNELSILRARYVYNFLVNSGINKDRLSYKGFGSCKPLVDEVDERTMQMNRRVEIMIVEK